MKSPRSVWTVGSISRRSNTDVSRCDLAFVTPFFGEGSQLILVGLTCAFAKEILDLLE
jgi:hypothetical protein